jgi:hypothetical protein
LCAEARAPAGTAGGELGQTAPFGETAQKLLRFFDDRQISRERKDSSRASHQYFSVTNFSHGPQFFRDHKE